MARTKAAMGALLVLCTGCQAPTRETPSAVVQDALNEALEVNGEARVIINLAPAPQSWPEHERRAANRRAQLNVLQRAGTGLRVIHEFRHIPAVAGVLSREALDVVRHLDNVEYVQIDEMGSGALAQAVPSTGADKVRTTLGIRGKGVRVAVLDSGASTTHPAIADSIVAEHCFTSAACPPSGTDEGSSAEDDNDHGSNVTGIITSNGEGGVSFGYAPDTEIVSVKVLDDNMRGWVSDWVSGLDWVYDNLGALKVRVVNLSLDTDSMYSSKTECDLAQPALANAGAQLNAAGVALFASTGNTGSTQTMGAPACNTGFIAVGATYDSSIGKQPDTAASYQALFGSPWPNCSDATTSVNTVTCFTNTGGKRLDVLAPGAILTSAGSGARITHFRGTSQAAPAAAGVAALMLECAPTLEPAAILDILKGTGQSVTDARTGDSFPLIRANAAVDRACSSSTGGAASTGGTSNVGGSGSGSTASMGGSGTNPSRASGGRDVGSGGTFGKAGSGNTEDVGGSSAGVGTGGGITSGGTRPNSGGQSFASGGSAEPASGGSLPAPGGRNASSSTTADTIGGAGVDSSSSAANTGGALSTLATHTSGNTTAVASQAEPPDVSGSCSCRTAGAPSTRGPACLLILLAMQVVRRGRRARTLVLRD